MTSRTGKGTGEEDPGASLELRLRADAEAILLAGVAAADPERLVAEALAGEPANGPPVTVVAAGKAAGRMALGVMASPLASRVREGVVVTPHGWPLVPGLPASLPQRSAGHPLPDAGSLEAAREVIRLGLGSDEGEFLLLLSGGGSALLALPAPGLGLREVQATTRALQLAGASIGELNTVRGALEVLKAGGLNRFVRADTVRALLLSDVIGNDPRVIASGPLTPGRPPEESRREALAVLRRRGVEDAVPRSVRRFLEAPPDSQSGEAGPPPTRPAVPHTVVGSVDRALEGAAAHARSLGYTTAVTGASVEGEAREVGQRLGREALTLLTQGGGPRCHLAGGETTVEVRGGGLGGRNQEVALGAALLLDGVGVGGLVASLGTDGVDGPTPSAGGMATWSTARRARALGMELAHVLAANDSHRCLGALGDLLAPGPTGTNVMDLLLVLARPAE